MKWISKVRVKNYKALVDMEQTFCKGLNVITGPTDKGKSTFIKAIMKCLTNKPVVDYKKLLTWGAKRGSKVEVEVWIKDDNNGQYSEEDAPEYKVHRIIGSNINKYELTYPDGEVQPFTGFGTKVPPEVVAVVGFREINMGYGKETLNYMSQFGGFFLLGKRPEEVAKAIGRLAQTELIDKIKEDLLSDITKNTRKLNSARTDLSEKMDKIAEYDYLEDIADIVSMLDEIIEFTESKEELIDMLNTVLSDIRKEARKLYEYEKLTHQDPKEVRDIVSILEEKVRLTEELRSVSSKIRPLVKALDKHSQTIVSSPDFSKLGELMDKLEGDVRALGLIKSISNKLYGHAENLSIYSETIRKDEHISEVKALLEPLPQAINQVSEISAIMNKVLDCSNDLQGYANLIERYKDVGSASTMISKIEESTKALEKIEGISSKVRALALGLCQYSSELKESMKNLDATKAELKEKLDGQCPVCGSDISDEQAMHLHL